MKEILDRLRADTPIFFQYVRAFGIYLMGISASILVAPEGIHIPDLVIQIAGYAATAGFIMSTIASFAKDDANKLPQ